MQTLDEIVDSVDNERIEIVLDAEHSLPAQDEKAAWNQEKLERLIKSLTTIIDSMDREPSFFSKMASFWASIPWWLQLIALTVIVATPMALGIVFSISALIALGASIFILYCGFSFLFYNQNQHVASNTDQIKEQIIMLANGLDNELQLLQQQTKQITQETTRFRDTNNDLATKIDTLETQLNQLTQQSTQLNKTKQDLHTDNEGLSIIIDNLDKANLESADQLQMYQQMMQQLKLDYKENSNQWYETICELNQTNTELDLELTQQKEISLTFKTNIEQMKGIVFTEEADKMAFQEKLEGLFTNKIDKAQAFKQRIEQANRERLILEAAITRCNQQFEQLVKREEIALTRMEADYGITSAGFFAQKDKIESTDEGKDKVVEPITI